MSTTNRKARRVRDARKRKRSPRPVEHVERFRGAPPEVRQAELIKRARTLAGFAEEAMRVFALPDHDPALFESMAAKIDAAFNAFRPRGDVPHARMAILQCVDDAVNFKTQLEQVADRLPTFDRVMAAQSNGEVTAEEKRTAGEVMVTCSALMDSRRLAAAGKDAASLEPWEFALYLLPLRVMDFAWALKTVEGMKAVRAAVDAWNRGPSDHGAGSTGPRKWEAANALMQAAGLYGTTEESLQSEWRAHRRDRLGKLAK